MGGDFGKLIARERCRRWVTSKSFYSDMKVSCSYARYTVIEKGGKPYASLDLARELIDKLKIEESKGLSAWVRDLMPNERTKKYFLDIDADDFSASPSILIEDKTLAKLFAQDAIFKEIAVYISMYSDRGVQLSEVVKEFSISNSNANLILNQLIGTGIIIREGKYYKVPNGYWINTPNSPEYRKSTTKVFADSINSHFSKPFDEGETIEHSIFRLLSPNQINDAKDKIRELARWFTLLEDESGAKPYRFFMGGNCATLGQNKKKYVPSERDIVQ